jgi:hypothetical protein
MEKNVTLLLEGKKMYERILSELQILIEQEVENFADDLGKMENAVKDLMASLGKGLLQRLVDRGSNGYQGSSIVCECGNSMKFIQHRKRDIHTVFGWITVKRAYYYCVKCGKGFAPYDKNSGFGSEQLSAGLAKACCLLAVDDSFEQTSRKIEQLLGQNVSDDTVKKVVHKAGSAALQRHNQELDSFLADKQIPQSQVKPEKLYIMPDGTTVHETDGWHESKVGCICWQDERFKEHKYCVGGFDNSEVFGWHLWLAACRCGLREAKEVIYTGDGAGWIRSEHHKHFGRATFIIDWYHGSEYIWDCGKKLFGEGLQVTEDWVKKRLDWLWDGWTKKLLDDLKQQHKKYRGVKREALETLIRYISSNEEQMRYDVFRSKGYKIGSGAVEGACKHVVGKRLKQSGMIWSRAGSSATLALRITWLNERWDELWSQKPLTA